MPAGTAFTAIRDELQHSPQAAITLSISAWSAGGHRSIFQGMTSDLGYDYRFEWNDIEITPGAGFMWNSKKQNDYYYGISSQESSRSGLKAYDPNDSFSPYLQLALDYPFAKSWKASVTARYTVLSSEVKNSPMVDKSGIASLGVDILYTF
ncbi:MipA/OmpV family protein [Rouxiella aceris]|nr:MipA/OmpV family protein [Rouxiella aceris]